MKTSPTARRPPTHRPPVLAPSTRRALGEVDAAYLLGILAVPMSYMPAPELKRASAERAIMEGAQGIRRARVDWYCPLLHEVREATRRHDSLILTGAQERSLFLKFNLARAKVSRLQRRHAGKAITLPVAQDALRWARLAQDLRDQIAETNLGLVLAMAKRVRCERLEHADLIGEGNMALMRAIDKFDCTRGFKFSTYACRAILKAFSRHGMKVAKHHQRFPASFDVHLEKSDHAVALRLEGERDQAAEVGWVLDANHAELTLVEREVIESRFGLTGPASATRQTLEQIGADLGITKERVRQIQLSALDKLRAVLSARMHRRPRDRVHASAPPSVGTVRSRVDAAAAQVTAAWSPANPTMIA